MSGAAVRKARAAWGKDLPDWVQELARQCDKSSQAQVARLLGNSTTVVSRLLSNAYPGNVNKLEAKVRGHFLAETVACPVLGDIPRQRCIAEQDKPLTFQNPLRKRVHEACRSGCPHSRTGAKS
jgi:transcriptional regulator with PAS, ATPase and Fis domain